MRALAVVECADTEVVPLVSQFGCRSCSRRISGARVLVPSWFRRADAMARRIAHRCMVAGATRVPFDDRTLDALSEIDRGNLRATDDLALKSLDYAAAAGHATVSVQHVVAARKDLWL